MASRRYVRENDHGVWEVLVEGHRRSAVHTATKAEAVERAREAVCHEGGGEIRVMNRAGKVVSADTVTVPHTRDR